MSVHRRKDGRFFVAYRDPQTQKTKQKYFGRGIDAERNAHEFNDGLDLRSYERRTPARYAVRFVDLVNAYAKDRRAFMQDMSYQNFMVKMRGVILPLIGASPALKIDTSEINAYVRQRIKDGVKLTTIHRELSDVQAVLNWSADPQQRYIPYNPIANYKKPPRDDAQIKPATVKETLKLIAHSSPHLVRAETISYYTGIRPGSRELFSRLWSDVDFDEQTIFVVSARKGGRFKSRNIPLHPHLFKLLKTWKKEDDNLMVKRKRRKVEYIIHYYGRPVKSLKKAFAKAKKDAGITRRLRLYDFRHAFATYTLKNAADLKAVSETLGHSRTDTTTRIYQHTDSKMHREAVEKLPTLDLDKH